MPIVPKEPRWRRYLRFWRSDVDADVDEELGFHFDSRVQELVARGVDAGEASRMALEEFGDVWAAREALRTIDRQLERRRGRALWLDALLQDLHYASRALRRQPMFTAAIVVTLALGVGAIVTMYEIVHRLVLAPPPHVAESARVGKLYFTVEHPDAAPRSFDAASFPFLEVLRRDARSFASVGAYTSEDVAVGHGSDAHRASATFVSAGFWKALGVLPAAGRLFSDEEAHPATGARVVVLGHGYWRGRFGGSVEAVGGTVEIKGQPYEIVGVAPRGFRGVELHEVDLWLPLYALGDGDSSMRRWHTFAHSYNLALVARLRDDAVASRAGPEVAALHDVFRAANQVIVRDPGEERVRWSATLAPLTGALGGDMKRLPEARVAVWLVGIAAVLLLVACTNVATLLLLRALRRRREIGIRLALGMSRARLAMLLFVETALLAAFGGVLAIAVVTWGGAAISRLLLPQLPWDVAVLDDSTLGVGLACVALVAMFVGLAPLTQGWADALPTLKDGGHAMRRAGAQTTLLVVQTALSVVLLLGAGLFVRSLHEIETLDLGMDIDDVIAVTVDFAGRERSSREVSMFYERMLERMSGVPGVERASLARDMPLRIAGSGSFQIAGRDSTFRRGDPVPSLNYVTPDFFATMGMRLVRGRAFEPGERTAPVAVINEAIARRFWPDGDAIGDCIYVSGPPQCTTIIGVVATARRFHLREDPAPTFFRPLAPDDAADRRVLLVRTAPSAEGMERRLRSAVQGFEPGLPYVDVRPLVDALDPQIRPWRLGATVFTAFGALAVLLVGIGLYSAVAFGAAQRTKELALRIAVGARSRHIVVLVLRQGLVIAALGILLGDVLGLAGGRFLEPLLFDVSARDVFAFAGAGGLALLAALLASFAPAWRARRTDPAAVLRTD